MLLEDIIDLTNRIYKRNDDKMKRYGQSDKIPSDAARKLKKTALGLKNRIRKQKDQIAAIETLKR